MKPYMTWTLLLVVHQLGLVCSSTDSEPLFLTPLIEQNNYQEARATSRVELFAKEADATAHSGFITVNKTTGSNLFFLYIQAKKNPDAYPLLLWLQGGPGLSSLFGEFLEIGPLGIDGKGRLFKRQGSLQRHVNAVYLDQPVGAGYSFTKGLLGYAKDLNDVSSGVLEFLDQFITMFPEYRNRTFYVGGESYGARFTVAVSHAILKGKEPRVPLRLRGVILGAGFLGRLMKVADSSEFLYEMSLVTKEGRKSLADIFADMRRKVRTLIGKLAALLRLKKTIFTSEKTPTMFQKLTGFNNQASALYSEKPLNMVRYEKYVQSDAFKRAVHVGRDAQFMEAEGKVSMSLKNDYLTDIRFTVAVSHAILKGKEPRVPLRLRGVILGAGFLGRLMKVADSSEFLYEMSLVTKEGRKSLAEIFADMRRKVRTLIGKLAALLRLKKTIFTSEKTPTMFQKLTGFNNQASALYSEKPLNMVRYEKYVQSDAFKRAVHVGRDAQFMEAEGKVSMSLKNDYLTDISHEIEDLLKSCKVLFYTGQMDTLFPSQNLQEYFRSLKWPGATEFRKAEPQHWKAYPSYRSVSGLVIRVRNMTDVVLFRAGHYTAVDEPDAANKMILNFIEGDANAWETPDDAKTHEKRGSTERG
nr:probable serine carboxypeptidase CPVL [Rhipicephalus microplus]